MALIWYLILEVLMIAMLVPMLGLAHCRHLKTVRTHLSELVLHRIVPANIPYDASCGLVERTWRELNQNGQVRKWPPSVKEMQCNASHVYILQVSKIYAVPQSDNN